MGRHLREVDHRSFPKRVILCVLLLAAATVWGWRPYQAVGDHGSRPSQRTVVPTLPLGYCRPVHVSSEPSEFRPGEAAQRFGVFVEEECSRRREHVTVEVWYRAPYRDGAGGDAFGMPYLAGFVETRTDLAE